MSTRKASENSIREKGKEIVLEFFKVRNRKGRILVSGREKTEESSRERGAYT